MSVCGAVADAAGRGVASLQPALDVLDGVMTILGFIPGLDVISEAYFLGRALLDVALGKGSWADVLVNAASLLLPVGIGAFKVLKTFAKATDKAGDAGRTLKNGGKLADGAKAAAKGDGVGDGARSGWRRAGHDDVVVRGGKNRPQDLQKNLDRTGGVSGLAGKSEDDLAQELAKRGRWDGKYGTTTVAEIRKKGGDVFYDNTLDPQHVTIVPGPGGIDELSALFRPVKDNPYT
ncbi:MAG: hypothetical protein A3K65_08695 [Euryarchaeota archaeon RBG_16_68_12]|nr:MAG: hypothetical protein A3K65_08695 [Euryarchaeota archaeon RBG_16_68_12]